MAAPGLKVRFLVVILGVYLATIGVGFLAYRGVVDQVANRLGAAYAGKYALANRALLQQPLSREVTLALQMGDSPAIREWARRESDPILRERALAELESYRGRLAEGSWFYVVGSSLSYYYDDPGHRYGPTRFAYRLSRDNPKDAWYFATLRDVKEYALNVNYDRALDARKVWVNAVVRDAEGRPIAMVGTGLDLSGFLREFVDRTEPGVENILLDRRMAIQAHRNRDLIDLQSLAKGEGQRSTLRRLIPGSDDNARIEAALARLKRGSPSEAVFVTIEGKPRLLGIAYLSDLEWYTVTVLDLGAIVRQRIFLPVFLLAIAMALALIGVIGWVVNRLVLTPLAAVTTAAGRIAESDYTQSLSSNRSDEIGTLTRVFSRMQSRIREDRDLLESRVRERTAELDGANRSLKEHAERLEEALSRVRTLSGMLPICCSCKKIRDDEGYWRQIEQYIQEHTGTEFSHGICPDCAKKLYPKYYRPPGPG